MSSKSSAIANRAPVLPSRSGLGWGLLGVAAFSLTVPFTRIAVGSLDPLFIGAGRAVLAAVLAATALAVTRQRRPTRRQAVRLLVVAGGIVAGFPLLTSYAFVSVPAAHGAVVIALLPAATATLAVLRGRERPAPTFWLFSALGAVAAVGFAAVQGGGFRGLHGADLLLLAAVVVGAIGYAEGGLLARELGAWQTVSWALVLAAPAMTALAATAAIRHPPAASTTSWLAFGYLGAVSMYLGFFAWYRGLAIGPMAQVSQVQLVQPVLTLGWAALILHEAITGSVLLGAVAVIGCAGLAIRRRRR